MMRFPRRQRTTFTQPQLDLLIEAFKSNHYPEANDRNKLAEITKLDPSRIQVWFQNQRAKARKRQGHSHSHSHMDVAVMHAVEHHARDYEAPPPHPSPQRVYVFDSSLANEAAQAVIEGRVASILEYHDLMNTTTRTHNQMHIFANS